MENQLKKYGEAFLKYDIIETAVISILFVAFFALGFFLRGIGADRDAALWKSLLSTPEPEICALCGSGDGIPYHAPVLVNLSTGETGEMKIYDPDPRHRCELAEEQSTGTFSFLHVAGLIGCRDTCDHSCKVTLPENREAIVPSHFCYDCRTILTGVATEGYILADLYNLNQITVYAIEDNTAYTIRDYAVSISSQDESGKLSIHVTGLLSMKVG